MSLDDIAKRNADQTRLDRMKRVNATAKKNTIQNGTYLGKAEDGTDIVMIDGQIGATSGHRLISNKSMSEGDRVQLRPSANGLQRVDAKNQPPKIQVPLSISPVKGSISGQSQNSTADIQAIFEILWACSGGNCIVDMETGVYATEEECLAARIVSIRDGAICRVAVTLTVTVGSASVYYPLIGLPRALVAPVTAVDWVAFIPSSGAYYAVGIQVTDAVTTNIYGASFGYFIPSGVFVTDPEEIIVEGFEYGVFPVTFPEDYIYSCPI